MNKIAVFGTGYLGAIHCKCIKQIANLELVGVYDPDHEKSQAVAKEFETVAFSTPESLLEQCDIADIVTSTAKHYDMAKLAICRGKHTFIEKPICGRLEDAEELIQLAQKHGICAQVGHIERFNPAFTTAFPYITTPMFIESHRLAFFNPQRNNVPVVLDLMIHDIDIILKIVNRKITDIQASGVAIVSDTLDIANARIAFEGGCVANLTASRLSLSDMRKIRVFQADAYISMDMLEKKTSIFRLEDVTDEEENPFAMIFDLGEDKGRKQLLIQQPQTTANNAIQSELESFLHAIESKTSPVVTFEDGYQALKVAYCILEKIKEINPLIK